MAFSRSFLKSFRCFHSAVRNLSDDQFNLSQIIKSNSAQKGFNDIKKKTSNSTKAPRSNSKQKLVVQEGSLSSVNVDSDQQSEFPHANDSKSSVHNRNEDDSYSKTKDETFRQAQSKADDTDSSLNDENKKRSEDSEISVLSGKSERKVTPRPQKDINGERYKVHIPDWMNVVLECPSNSVDEIDLTRFGQFKNFIEDLEIRNLPSVTTIIKKTEPETQAKVLRNWTQRKTKELGGEKQFQEFKQKLFTRGSSLHDYIERYLKGERGFDVEPRIEGPWESVQHVLADITNVKDTEKVIAHPVLFYKGQIDCLAAYRDEMALVEWKVSSKPKLMLSQTYDNPLQVAAYVGALNRSGVLNRMKVSNIKTGILVIAYEDGEPASVHEMDERLCNKYWGRWKERLYHYWALQYQQMMTSPPE